MKTIAVKPSDANVRWYLVDASNKVLGRLASEIAMYLKGKRKPEYTPNLDVGDHVVVINAAEIRVTGNKAEDKNYFTHSGYMGGDQQTPFNKLLAKKPELVLELAIKGMLPKGPLGRRMFEKLHVYGGADHLHAAQQPEKLEI